MITTTSLRAGLVAVIAILCPWLSPAAHATSILVQSTTSTANSGLYDYVLPHFTMQTDITVKVVAVGTGQAIRNAQNCDADVLLVHAKDAEESFVAEGFGVSRSNLMYNDFVIVGPANDPVGIAEADDATHAFSMIAAEKMPFASRGDNSGTHTKEQDLWQGTGFDPTEFSGAWYRETGSGMGATLNIAVGMGAYTLTDRATWLSFANKQDFDIVYEGDSALFNQYGIIQVNPEHCENVDAPSAQTFVDWMLSEEGQSLIASYRQADQQLFFPNASKSLE